MKNIFYLFKVFFIVVLLWMTDVKPMVAFSKPNWKKTIFMFFKWSVGKKTMEQNLRVNEDFVVRQLKKLIGKNGRSYVISLFRPWKGTLRSNLDWRILRPMYFKVEALCLWDVAGLLNITVLQSCLSYPSYFLCWLVSIKA